MATFYICRHGETENNKRRRLSGWIDSPLTKEGLAETESAAAKLKNVDIDMIYSSDLGRAFITAYIIARKLDFNGEITRLFGLRENSYGDIAYMPSIEAEAMYPKLHRDTNYIPPNGESLAQMQERVLETVTELDRVHADKTMLLVAHDGVIKAIRTSFSGQDLGEHNISAGYAHDFVASFTLDDGKVASFTELE
ncbi:MAG: phosphoglycerate mutase [Candidatus Saccharibacteria bacterium]|nr:phosphoglycerate mutase [Candidatus Saccharibacteria bacterium]